MSLFITKIGVILMRKSRFTHKKMFTDTKSEVGYFDHIPGKIDHYLIHTFDHMQ